MGGHVRNLAVGLDQVGLEQDPLAGEALRIETGGQ